MNRSLLAVGAVLGFFAVALGAFGAHGLESRLAAERMATFHTGSLYHLTHTFAVLAAGFLASLCRNRLGAAAGWCFVFGVVVFSGSLYLLATSELWSSAYQSWLGAITPFGGVGLLVGWILLLIAICRGGRDRVETEPQG